jgi:glycosyltransferase involved in cell wall biosynthesis
VTVMPDRLVSIIIPAHNQERSIGRIVSAVRKQTAPGAAIEVIVADDGSTDATVEAARAAGARVVPPPSGAGGNPAAARNRGAAASRGDPLIFLDSDCTPASGWLAAIMDAHDAGATMVGGALDMPPGLSATARCDYYCGWYLIHSRRAAGYVPHHPPPNLSVRREAFFATGGFTERQPFSYTNEERHWQAELRRAGHRIWFEPKALAFHENRPGFLNLLKRNYRWAYSAVEAKSETGSARMAWLYRYPRLVILASFPLAFAHAAYILWCWLRAGVFEPVLMTPAILASRFAYAAGMAVGGTRWLRSRKDPSMAYRPQWR